MKHTITSNEEVNRLFSDADKSIQTNLIVLCANEYPERDQRGRVAYLAGKRLGNAPKRNKAKRLLREAARLAGAPWSGLRVVLVARNASLESGVAGIRKDIERAFADLNSQHLSRVKRIRRGQSEPEGIAYPVDSSASSHKGFMSVLHVNEKQDAKAEEDMTQVDSTDKGKRG